RRLVRPVVGGAPRRPVPRLAGPGHGDLQLGHRQPPPADRDLPGRVGGGRCRAPPPRRRRRHHLLARDGAARQHAAERHRLLDRPREHGAAGPRRRRGRPRRGGARRPGGPTGVGPAGPGAVTAPHPPVRILVVEGDGEVRRRLVADLEALLDERAEVRAVATAAEALAAAHRAVGDGGLLPLALIERTLPDGSGGAVATQLHEDPALAPTRKVLLTSEPSLKDVGSALSHGAVHGMLHRPWTRTGLREHVGAHLRPLAAQHPVLAERFGDLLEAAAGPPRPADVEAVPDDVASVLLDPTIDDAAIERLMVEVLDAALGEPPRLRVAPGAVLIEEGDDVGGIYVVLDGEVALSRHDEGGRHLLHSASTGPILGLLSLTGHKRAFLRC